MAPKFIFSLTITFLLLPFFISADTPPSTPTTPGNVCDTAPDPKFCKAVLPNHNASVYDSGRYSFRKSISQTRKFLNIVDKYLARRSSLSKIAVRALEDCRFLASLSMDYLSTSFSTVNVSNNTLSTMKADDVQSFLSASLTNQQTCLEGLQTASTVNNDLANPLVNDTKLYSVSLALFTKGWVPKTKKWKPKRKQRAFSGGKLPLKFSNKASNVFESLKGRKTLETVTEVNAVTVSDIVIVNQTGSGDFITINDAVAAAPNNTDGSNGYFMIYIAAGVYEEYVSIPKNKKYLMMVGDGINQTVITGNRSVVDGWTTFNSATFAVTAPNFIAVNITIRNTAGAIKHQAVALRSGADLSTFYSCSFEGYQDTLYTHSLRQFYSECDIYGTVDFIFGNAAVVFQNCNLYPRLPMRGQFNAITAQGRTDPNQNTGISIHNCKIRAADDLASSNMTVRTFLGRPWKEYSRTVYMQTFMDSLIQPAGWQIWSGDFALKTLYYAEYNNTGPGSDTSNRVTWEGYHIINATDAANYTVSGFLLGQDWIPQTGVPFNSDLL